MIKSGPSAGTGAKCEETGMNHLGVLFTSVTMTDAAYAVMPFLYWTVVVKKELHNKVTLSICWSICVTTLTYDHDRKNKMTDPRSTWVYSTGWLRDRLRSTVTWEEFLHIEMSQQRWLGHLYWIRLDCLPGNVFWAC